jgi:hypothetical protein
MDDHEHEQGPPNIDLRIPLWARDAIRERAERRGVSLRTEMRRILLAALEGRADG